jgi:hypothetical protein
MSSPNLVPVFDPQGNLRDVPSEQLREAVGAGGVPAHPVQGPDGTTRMIPVTRLSEAVQAGGKIINSPVPDAQLPAYYGFTLGNVASNVWEGAKSVVQGTYALGKDLLQNPNWVQGDTSTLHKFVEQPMLDQSAKAAQSFAAGNTVEGVGHTIASGLPLVGPWAASLGEQAGTGDIGGALAKGAGQVGALKVGQTALSRGISAVRNPSPVPTYPGAQLPAAPEPRLLQANALMRGPQPIVDPAQGLGQIPVRSENVTPELLQARGLARGATTPPPEPSDVLGQIPVRAQSTVTPTQPSTLPNPSPEAASTIPRTLSGESALGQVLSRLDNASLLRIARSRGIDVRQESLLKPGTANNLLINKIANDFTPDELLEFSARYLENSRFQHQFSNQMTPEAWSTVAMKSYFPDVKLPQTVLARTQKAMTAADVVKQAIKMSRR